MTRLPPRLGFLGLLGLPALVGCGSDPEPAAPSDVRVVRTAAMAGAWTSEGALDTEVRPEAVGVDGGGHVVAVSGGVTYALERGALAKKPMYADVGDIPSLGDISAIADRPNGGAWLASDRGLFSVDRHFVVRSPVSEALSGLADASEAAGGPLVGLWLVADGLYRQRGEVLDEIAVPGLSAPNRVAVSRDGQWGLVTDGTALALLRAEGGELVARALDLGLGDVRDLARGPDAVWAATAQGLLRADASGLTRFDLGPNPIAVAEVAVDASTGTAWARIDGALVAVQGASLVRYPTGANEAGLAVDQLGDVYTIADGALIHRGTGAEGSAVTFQDVLPWIQTHCSACHMNQTANFEDYEVFADRAEDALSRVRSGDMPRCQGSLRCDEDQALSPTDYAVLEQWIRDGLPE